MQVSRISSMSSSSKSPHDDRVLAEMLPGLGRTTEYDDSNPSCSETFATLRITSDAIDPHEISQRLQLSPSSAYRKGEPISPRVATLRDHHGWLLSSEAQVQSQDVRRHLDWLLDQLLPRSPAYSALIAPGTEADIFVFWQSRSGQGGPILSPPQLSKLALLQLEIIFDVYYSEPEAASDDDESS